MKSSKKALLLASVSKLALIPGLASAQGGKDDEMAPADPAPQLKLNQVVVPFDAFIPPFNDADTMGDGSMFEDELENFGSTGVIFVGEIDKDARMDFIISNIRNDKPVDVFLVMGTELAADAEGDMFPGLAPTEFSGPVGQTRDGKDLPAPKPDVAPNAKPAPKDVAPNGISDREDSNQQLEILKDRLHELTESGDNPKELKKVELDIRKLERELMKVVPQKDDDWQGLGWKPKPKSDAAAPMPVHGGEICVDIANGMEIIAAVHITPKKPIMAQEFSLGQAIEPHFTSTIVSVKLDKEKLLQFTNQEVYFQAAVIPVNDNRGLDQVLADAGQVSECDRYLISNVIDADEENDIEAEDGSKNGGSYYDDETDEMDGEYTEADDNGSKF